MMIDPFKKYKPSSWDVVKGDYSYTDEVPDEAHLFEQSFFFRGFL